MPNTEDLTITIKAVNNATRALKSVQKDLERLQLAEQKVIKSTDKLDKSGRNLGNNIQQARIAIGAVSAGLLIAGKRFVKAAADAEETESRFRAVFKDEADEAEKFVQKISKALGRAKTELRTGLASFQGLALGLGFAEKNATKFSTKLTDMAIDFASFNNITTQETISRFIAAMSGSSEVLDQFGVNIRSSALEAELLSMGINKTTNEATEMEKTMARLNIIEKVMGKQGALGDAERTAGSMANTLVRLNAQKKELAETIGKDLNEVIKPFIVILADLLQSYNELDPATKKIIVKVGIAVAVFASLLAVIAAITFALPILVTAFAVIFSPIGLLTIAIIGLIAVWNNFLGIREPIEDFFEGVGEKIFDMTAGLKGVQSAIEAVGEAFNLLEGFGEKLGEGIFDFFNPADQVNDLTRKLQSQLGETRAPIRRQSGGLISAGQTALVGERGPEIIRPLGNTMVTPNNKIGGGMTNNINISGNFQTEEQAQGLAEIITQTINRSMQKESLGSI